MKPSLSSILVSWLRTRRLNGKKFDVDMTPYVDGSFGITIMHQDMRHEAGIFWTLKELQFWWFTDEYVNVGEIGDPDFFKKVTEWLRKQVYDHRASYFITKNLKVHGS